MAERNEPPRKKDSSWIPNEVVCPGKCQSTFYDPRILPCLHSFCRNCLEKQIEESGDGSKDKPTIQCRVCKRSTTLPEKGVGALPQNLRLKLHSKAVSYAQMLDGSTPECDECLGDLSDSGEDPSNEAPASNTKSAAVARKSTKNMNFCCACQKFLCHMCTRHHQRSRETYKHTKALVNIADKRKAKEQMINKFLETRPMQKEYLCTEDRHGSQPLCFYCLQCDDLVCQTCVLGDHKGHEYKQLQGVADEHRQEMETLLNPAGEALSKLGVAIGEHDVMMKQVATAKTKVQQELTRAFDEMEAAMKKRKKQLLDTTEHVAAVKRTRLDIQKRKFDEMKSEIEQYQKTSEKAMRFTDEELVAYKRFLQIELERVLEQFKKLRLQVNESDAIPRDLDAQGVTSKIDGFGTITSGCSPEQSSVMLYIPWATKGKEKKVVVTGRDDVGNPFGFGGEDVVGEFQFVGADRWSQARTIDRKDGTYSLLFTPQAAGELKLQITIRNRLLCEDPLTLWVHEPRDYTALPTGAQQTITSQQLEGNNVFAVAVHQNGDLYVAQNDYLRIVDHTDGKTKKKIGGSGNGNDQFAYPSAIALQGEFMFICDANNHRVLKRQATGDNTYLVQFGKKGAGNDEFNTPRGICLDPLGRIFVADSGNHRVQVLNADGTFHRSIPIPGGNPWDLTFDPEGQLHVACNGTKKIHIYTSEGAPVREYGKDKINYPSAIAINDEGYSFVTEYNGTSSRLLVFGPPTPEREQPLVKEVPGFKNPESVALKSDGSIYVGDKENYRILKF